MEAAGVLKVTATGAVLATSGYFIGAVLAAGADAATLILYDDPDSANGTQILKLSAVATGSVQWSPGVKVPVQYGIYAVLTGTSPQATVVFKP